MKKTIISTVSILGILMLLATACVKEVDMNETYRPEGSPITFTAATGYENGDGTRTEYSGKLFDGTTHDEVTSATTNTYERINWVDKDAVTIAYKHVSSVGSAKYEVSGSPTNEAEHSQAAIKVASGSSALTWAGGSGDHIFTAMYPAYGFGGNETIAFDGTKVAGRIPATQTLTKKDGKYLPDMSYAYMVAYKKIDGSSTEREVVLPFSPAMTAFEFRLKMPAALQASYKVKSFAMESEGSFLAGDFEFNVSEGDERGAKVSGVTVKDNVNRSRRISVSFGEGVSLSKDNYLIFTILAVPKDITDLTLMLTYDDGTADGRTGSTLLKAAGTSTPYEFKACKKYIISNTNAGLDDWVYEVEDISDIAAEGTKPVTSGLSYTVKSYRYSKSDPTIKEKVTWKLQFSSVDPSVDPVTGIPVERGWADVPSDGYANTDFWMGMLNGVGSTTGEEGAAKLLNDCTARITGDENAVATRQKLANATFRGSDTSPFDLSMHAAYGDIDATTSQTTANCYTISAPGVYMFPCVYGNAITKDKNNVSAYCPAASDALVDSDDPNVQTLSDIYEEYMNTTSRRYYTPYFYSAINQPITQPYIIPDLTSYGETIAGVNAAVVWQDTEVGKELIPYTNHQNYVGTKTVGGNLYIWFKIDKDHIKPGNLMIALRGSASGPYMSFSETTNILWSWHIWVTAENLDPNVGPMALGDYKLMPINLGWSDSDNGSVEAYGRRLYFRAIQTDASGNILSVGDNEEFVVKQVGPVISTTPSVGGNAYYQWGRKDPFLPSTPSGGNHPVSVHPDYREKIVFDTDSSLGGVNIPTSGLDYSSGIRAAYWPLFSFDETSQTGSTGWIQGPVYPWEIQNPGGFYTFTKKLPLGPYTFNEAVWFNNVVGLTDGSSWIVPTDTADPQESSNWYMKPGYAYYKASGLSETGKNQLIAYFPTVNSMATVTEADFVETLYYPTLQRQNSGCPSNLWNSYIYDEITVNPANKFKTVYDPCPPGFTVPGKELFIGSKFATHRDANHPTFCKHTLSSDVLGGAPTLVTVANDEGGMNIPTSGDGVFLPYTGARIFRPYTLKPEGQNKAGYYWTDSPFAQSWQNDDPATQIPYSLISFSFYHSAYALLFGNDSAIDNYVSDTYRVQTYTRGSALSIRPVADPKY